MAGARPFAAVALAALVAGAAAQPLPADLDHYLCYRATPAAGSVAFAPVDATLRDRFDIPVSYSLRGVRALCTPVDKNGEGILRPEDHQVAYRIRPRKGEPRITSEFATIDQFGGATMVLERADHLLVPSSKALGPGSAPPYTGTGVRHYTCYRVRGASVPPPPPTLVDQFGTTTPPLRKVTKLCTPTDKNGEDPTAPLDPALLVCYRLKGPKPRVIVSTDNQIRPERLTIRDARELCVPALEHPQATMSTSTTVPGSTTTTTMPLPCGDPAAAPAPLCWGACPAETPICAATPSGCECVAGTTPCGSASFPECDGACAPDEACVVSLTLGCTCQPEGLPCALAYAFTGGCGGVCPTPGYECVGPVFTSDGDGCLCIPEGSTCHLTCDPEGGDCPPGQSCQTFIPSLCLCQ